MKEFFYILNNGSVSFIIFWISYIPISDVFVKRPKTFFFKFSFNSIKSFAFFTLFTVIKSFNNVPFFII